jgi:hypothetical protein
VIAARRELNKHAATHPTGAAFEWAAMDTELIRDALRQLERTVNWLEDPAAHAVNYEALIRVARHLVGTTRHLFPLVHLDVEREELQKQLDALRARYRNITWSTRARTFLAVRGAVASTASARALGGIWPTS